VRLGQFVVDLDGVAEFERRLLKLLLGQVGFAALDVFGFGFFGIGTGDGRKRTGGDDEGEQNRRQTPAAAGARALFVIHSVFRTPSRLSPSARPGQRSLSGSRVLFQLSRRNIHRSGRLRVRHTPNGVKHQDDKTGN
jgi:hypothetical protein